MHEVALTCGYVTCVQGLADTSIASGWFSSTEDRHAVVFATRTSALHSSVLSLQLSGLAL